MSDFNEPEESPIISIEDAFAAVLNTRQMPTGFFPRWVDISPILPEFVPYILDAHQIPKGILHLRGKGALSQIETSAPPPQSTEEGTNFVPVFRRKILPKRRNDPPFGNLIARIPREINPVPKEYRRVSSARRLISKN
jgi:hypothetical protein